MCTATNKSADIALATQKLKLSFNRFKKNPLNNISSNTGETATPRRMLNESADLCDSIAPTLLPEIIDSPTITNASQTATTIMLRTRPRLLIGVLNFRYWNGRSRQVTRVMNAGNTQITNLTVLENTFFPRGD